MWGHCCHKSREELGFWIKEANNVSSPGPIPQSKPSRSPLCLSTACNIHAYLHAKPACSPCCAYTHNLSVQMDGYAAGHPEPAACPLSVQKPPVQHVA